MKLKNILIIFLLVKIAASAVVDDSSFSIISIGKASDNIPFFTDKRRRETLSWLTESSPQYKELLDTWTPYVVDGNKIYDTELMWPDAVMPLVLFGMGPSGKNGTWEENVRSKLMKSINAFPYTNHDHTRSHMAEVILSVMALKTYYDINYFTPSQETEISQAFDKWANQLAIERVETADSDENIHRWGILMLLKRLTTKQASLAADNAFKVYENLVNTRHMLDDGTAGGGHINESTSYDSNTARLAGMGRDIAEFYGENVVGTDWYRNAARNAFMQWIPDESGVLLFHDYQGSANSSKGTYPEQWDKVYEAKNHRVANICANGLLNTQGTPEHKALIYFLDKLTPKITTSKIHYKHYQNIWFRNPKIDATPNSISEITDLDLAHNAGNRNRIYVRENNTINSGYFTYAATQSYRADHQHQGAAYAFGHGSASGFGWVTHGSVETGGSNKTAPINTIYIENFGSSTANADDIVEGYFPGSQGPNNVQVGKPLTLGFLKNSSSNEFIGLVTQNHTRFHNDHTYNAKTSFLKQWTRSIIHEWSGLNIVFDRIRMDVSDYDDIKKRHKLKIIDDPNSSGVTTLKVDRISPNFPTLPLLMEVARSRAPNLILNITAVDPIGKSISFNSVDFTGGGASGNYITINEKGFNREVVKVTRQTSVPKLHNGWYEYEEFGKKSYYKPLNPSVPSIRVIDEQKDEPWATAKQEIIYQNNKISHIQESITGKEKSEDDITFLSVTAFGDKDRKAPSTFGPFESTSGNVSAVGVVDGDKIFCYLFNRDPDSAFISSTEKITFSGMLLTPGTKIRAAGWNNSTKFTVTALGSDLSIVAGSGNSPIQSILEDVI